VGRQPKNIKSNSIRNISFFILAIFLVKMFWFFSLSSRGLLGADGENYLEGVTGLLNEGLFSENQKLLYWPAGYPMLMWPIAELTVNNFGLAVGTIQSTLYSVSIYIFAREILQSSLTKYTWHLVLLLNLNPTLSLSSVVIGYETPVASLFLIAISMFMRNFRSTSEKNGVLNRFNLMGLTALTLSTFLQPRMVVLSIGLIIPYALIKYKGKTIAVFLILSSAVMSLAPATLATRNLITHHMFTVSTNLGTTMNIGAGPGTNGGYPSQGKGVPCKNLLGDAAQKDRILVKCVLTWYVKNPTKVPKLLYNKAIFHWSPWIGPLASGTMARNPWLKIHPLRNSIAKPQYSVDSSINALRVFSYFYIFASLILLYFGFYGLWLKGNLEKLLSLLLLIPVALNTFSSMLTIGDHRFRIPTMTLSLVLQLFGIQYVLKRKEFQSVNATIETKSTRNKSTRRRKN